jgi:phage-related holin
MSHNPYAPPTAPVDDISSVPPLAPDGRDVQRACHLIWVGYWIQLVELPQDYLSSPYSVVTLLILDFVAFGLGFLINRWVVSKLRARRNWMRILLTSAMVLFTLLLAFLWDEIVAQYATSAVRALVFGVQFVVGAVSTVLLFTPRSRAWFAPDATATLVA